MIAEAVLNSIVEKSTPCRAESESGMQEVHLLDIFLERRLPNTYRVQRVRDPVHGLIVFTDTGDNARLDQAAWKLLNTSEFQRLRRIRQLGVTEATFPCATHSRFAHSIGVFHTARQLVAVVRRFSRDTDFNKARADVAVLAALVHDIGHGPFSHAFESAQKHRGVDKRHEKWTAELVRDPTGSIFAILEWFRRGAAEEVAELLEAENPNDEYHAIVSSSFDADRLDYLRRDRLMTGSGAGAIDFDWLIDNIRIADVPMSGDDDEDGPTIRTFCLDEKAIQAAEAFLLSRYHLFDQIYLHKTTRGLEVLLKQMFNIVASASANGSFAELGLNTDDPYVKFFGRGGQTRENYLSLDDLSAWALIFRLAIGPNTEAAEIAQRIRDRRLLRVIDINTRFPIRPNETIEELETRRQREMDRIERNIDDRIGHSVFRDAEPISVYGEAGADEAKKHKKLSILLKDGTTREISQLSPVIKTLIGKRMVVRYYCIDDSVKGLALEGCHDQAR